MLTSAINAWVRDIIIMVVSLSFVEMMLPQNGLKRMVRLVIGIAIIGVILNPIAGIRMAVQHTPISGPLPWGSPPPGSSHMAAGTPDASAYIERGRRVAAAGEAAAVGAARSRVERQVRALALVAADVEDAEVRVRVSASGGLEGINVAVTPRSGGETMEASLDRIVMTIAEFCGVPKEKVQVSLIPPRGDHLERR